jgi:hypothetical protein
MQDLIKPVRLIDPFSGKAILIKAEHVPLIPFMHITVTCEECGYELAQRTFDSSDPEAVAAADRAAYFDAKQYAKHPHICIVRPL